MLQPLTKEQVASVVAGRGAAERVPVTVHMWVHPKEFGERQAACEALLSRYPEDVQWVGARMPNIFKAATDDPEYRWVNYAAPKEQASAGLDAQAVIPDWGLLDGILKAFPNPRYQGLFADAPPPDGRYRAAHFYYCLFERHWSLRGMTNALTDYYTDPECVHRLYRALTDFYLVFLERAKEAGCDALMTSDDLGTQTGPFFSPAIFRAFFKPYYREIIVRAHELGMHFWLHCCGNIEPFLPDFIEIGLDVLHPIQKYTMDERVIAQRYGKDLCIWSGFDVQQTIPWGTPADVRKEVRHLMDTYWRPEGRLMFTAGNGVNGDCTLGSLEALLDEAFRYGAEVGKGTR